jgi:hypothetical protein
MISVLYKKIYMHTYIHVPSSSKKKEIGTKTTKGRE